MIDKILINLFTAVIELIVVIELYTRFNMNKKCNYKIALPSIVLYLVFSVIATYYISEPFIMLLANCIIYFILSFAYKLKMYKRVLAIITVYVISIAYEMLVGLIVGAINEISIKVIQSDLELYLLICIISKFLLYITIKIIVMAYKPTDKVATKMHSILHLLFPLSSFIILFILSYVVYNSDTRLEKIVVLLAAIVLIVANIATFILYDIAVKREVRLHNNEVEAVLISNQKKEYESLIESQLDSNKMTHDLKNKMFAIKACIESSNPRALLLVDELCEVVSGSQIIQYTKLNDLDALLNAKIHSAKLKNIIVKTNIFVDRAINIDSIDLCVLLGNILDNGIESCERLDDCSKSISLTLRTRESQLAIKCENSTQLEKYEEGNTSKNDKLAHGFGLNKIKEIADKYDGSAEYLVRDKVFITCITMKNDHLCS